MVSQDTIELMAERVVRDLFRFREGDLNFTRRGDVILARGQRANQRWIVSGSFLTPNWQAVVEGQKAEYLGRQDVIMGIYRLSTRMDCAGFQYGETI